MQTKQQIQQLLSSAGVSPNKRFGQHFLIDLNLMRLLIDAADIHGSDIVFEVGCGTGSLTEDLAEKAGKVIIAELDENLARIASRQLAEKENVQIINTDVLENKNAIHNTVADALGLARREFSGRLMLVANLPYGAASPVMLNLVTGPVIADSMYVTVQKEVAERMTASPGGKHYGTLSIFLGATGETKTIRILKPSVFWPPPEVESAMVSFVRSKEKAKQIRNMGVFGEVVNLFMQHRRKMLKACSKFAADELAGIHDWSLIFEACAIDPHKRPEQLLPQDYIAIANLCSQQLNQS
ncbi:MAG TPA: 16S rRNA (adenine(1518)-N(6)/adenine(1519)-N(6))-dimethyltransferase RsmA [Sedimentisphaerales bacterium]|nr:16S rRNA (adenine(1518)-N(6)/adenine(1519)-N(6))-dimethyltransferase RsmA [Sedimentisphaerales bacterium]